MTAIENAARQLCDACDAVEKGFDELLAQVVKAAEQRKLKDTSGRCIGVTQLEMNTILQARDALRKILVEAAPKPTQ